MTIIISIMVKPAARFVMDPPRTAMKRHDSRSVNRCGVIALGALIATVS